MNKAAPWANRIVGYGEIAPDQVLAHEGNWKIHPKAQQDALQGVLTEVGIVQNIIINKRTSELWPEGERNVETLLDGHARITLALRSNQPSVPVTYVDLTPAEESEILLTLDPLAAMAIADREKLDTLMHEVRSDEEAVQQMLEDLAKREGLLSEGAEDSATLLDQAIQLKPTREYAVIMCETAEDWEQLKVALGLVPVRRGGYKPGSQFDSVGTQRVVLAADVLRRLGVAGSNS